MPSAKVKRAITAFEEAIRAITIIDSVPPCRSNREEQELLTQRTIAEHNYIKARAKLERLMENL